MHTENKLLVNTFIEQDVLNIVCPYHMTIQLSDWSEAVTLDPFGAHISSSNWIEHSFYVPPPECCDHEMAHYSLVSVKKELN